MTKTASYAEQSAPRAQHTPGPWYIGMRPGPMIYGDAPRGAQVADMSGPLIPADENSANARLIAAAPDLLAALREIADLPGYVRGSALEMAVQTARAAIAKAEGGQ